MDKLIPVPNFSGDLNEAWAVIEKMETKEGFVDWQIRSEDMTGEGKKYSVSICMGRGRNWVSDDSLPRAICLSAIKEVEIAEEWDQL